MYTPILIFFVCGHFVSNILNSKIHEILISYLAPVSFKVVFDQTSFILYHPAAQDWSPTEAKQGGNPGSRNKLYKTKLTGLGKQINQLDIENALNPSLDTYKKMLQFRYKYNNIVYTEML